MSPQARRSRLRHQVVTLALNRRSLVSPTEVHPLCVLHQCYCFANAQPPSSHLLLTPHSFFSHPVLHHAFSEDQSSKEWVDRSIGLFIHLQGGKHVLRWSDVRLYAALLARSNTADLLYIFKANQLVCPLMPGQLGPQKAQSPWLIPVG